VIVCLGVLVFCIVRNSGVELAYAGALHCYSHWHRLISARSPAPLAVAGIAIAVTYIDDALDVEIVSY